MYNLPSSDEVGALVVEYFDTSEIGRDIIVKKNSGDLMRIHETHTTFIPLQYPLLFPYGEDGYQEDIPIRGTDHGGKNRKRLRITLREFIAFRIQQRNVEFGNIVNGGKLYQQFLVDTYTMIESQRLSFIRNNKSSIRSEILNCIEEAVSIGETDPSSAGKRVILPVSFTGSMRYLFNNNQDAMAICKKVGYPDLFITFTCNSGWAEITRFLAARGLKAEDRSNISCRLYLSSSEVVWRILAFDIHERWLAVQRLNFHLPNHQVVFFRDDEGIDDIFNKNKDKDTMFIAWMEANKVYPEVKELTYAEFPNKFIFYRENCKWQPRKKGFLIGRLHYIPPRTGELYYLCLLLTMQRGCCDYESIRTVNGVILNNFQEACYSLGLLCDDKEFVDGIKEANEFCLGHELRKLFVTLLMCNIMVKPDYVWEKIGTMLSDDILYQQRKKNRNLVWLKISLADELNYNTIELAEQHCRLLDSLTMEQKVVYHEIMNSVLNKSGDFFFLYGYEGTGKTYIWNTLSVALRSKRLIVLNVASSGIASLLFPGERIAHSKFSIPLMTNNTSTCKIKQRSLKADLLINTSLIIWNEAIMLNKFYFEALDRTLRDLMRVRNSNSMNEPFGGKVVVLGGDFRQILLVIAKGSREDVLSVTVNSSYLWAHCKVLKLTKNMRLSTSVENTSAINETKFFADWILQIGDGQIGVHYDEDCTFEIPEEFLILKKDNSLMHLVEFAYPNLVHNCADFKFFEQRAILAPTLESVEKVNELIISLMPGKEREYLSSDSTCSSDENSETEGEWFTTEFLNEVKCLGIPNHRLILKICVLVMLLRNIDQANELCNRTRLIVNQLERNILAATVVMGRNIGDKVFIPRMNLVLSNSRLPFKFQRRQFSLALCFAMTINKS
ncbi:uncharacterized protein LOC113866646 [Abrus precatorius]|uniref:ATP-dependent DNA helicase n=1 Tax=Abrus precatorius TaxID=3816 RepID=A0A8B8LQV4_ABRPR|nr:uncharacterized protein LOC113866646 [Abrus precatorius]